MNRGRQVTDLAPLTSSDIRSVKDLMMKVLGIAGSPRRSGNTELLLDRALEGARSTGAEVEKIVLNLMKIRGCQHCDGCLKTGMCVIKDDMQKIYPKLKEADHLILASPVFFMGLTSQAKAMIDRCQCLWVAKYILKLPEATSKERKRKGLFISVGGMNRPNLFTGNIATVKAIFATLNVAYREELLFPGIDEKGEILNHPPALQQAYEAGRRLVEDS